MVTLDGSIIPALVIFVALIFALNYLLFRPLQAIQDERAGKTTGLMAQVRKKLDHHTELFNQYQAVVKKARLDGYRRQEQSRSEAMAKRAEALDAARKHAEQMLREAQDSIRHQVDAAKAQLDREAQEMAQGIVRSILQRSA
jgi:F-type H+-transporting ATPase subunit b